MRALRLGLAAGVAFFLSSCGSVEQGPCAAAITPWSTSVDPPVIASTAALNVKDFHAVGDGITDDTAAFNDALGALATTNGGTLLIPPGTYLVGDVRLGNGTAIRGLGTPPPVLAKNPTASSILSILSNPGGGATLHDISIEQLTLRGRSVQDGFSEHVHNLLVVGVTRLSVRKVSFEAFQGDGVYLGTRLRPADAVAHNSSVMVDANAFDGVNAQNRNGVSVIDCTHCMIDSNSFSRITRPDMPGAIDLEPNQRDELINDVAVTNNTISGSGGSAGAISVSLAFKDFLQGPGHILIQNNQVQNAKTGIFVLWEGPVTSQTPSLDTLIWGNVVSNVDHPLQLDGVAGITIAHNGFSDSGMDVQLGCGAGAASVRFSSNGFTRVGALSGQGFILCGPLTALTFDGNNLVDLGSSATNGSAVRFANGTTANINYTGNVFSSPNQTTHVAFSAAANASFAPATNTWSGNVLNDGIQLGVFPNAGSAAGCGTH